MKHTTSLPPGSGVEASGTLPSFLIIGAMRSGTSALAEYLSRHPQVFVAPRKEIQFFTHHFDNGPEWYRGQFANAGDAVAIGEATPGYMYDRRALGRMASALPRARLISILRNPVDRAYSHYWLRRAKGRERLEFAQAVAAERARLATGNRRDRLAFSYLDRGRYLEQLMNVREHYPHEALLILIFEELQSDPVSAYRSACRFLRVDDSFLPSNLGERVGDFFEFRSLGLRSVARGLPHPLGTLIGRLNMRHSRYPPMDVTTRESLTEHFADDNAALARWMGRDLSLWDR